MHIFLIFGGVSNWGTPILPGSYRLSCLQAGMPRRTAVSMPFCRPWLMIWHSCWKVVLRWRLVVGQTSPKCYGHFQGENLPLFVGLIQCGVNLGSLSLNKYTWLWPTWVAVSLREPLMKTLKINGRRQTFFAGYIACKGDWPWLRKAYGLVTGFTSKRICHLCDSHEPKMHVSECP